MTEKNDPTSKFKNLLKLKDGEPAVADPSVANAKPRAPRKNVANTSTDRSQVKSARPTTTRQKPSNAKPGPTERVNITISPKSDLYAALNAARSELPPAFRSQTLSSLLLRYLADNDQKFAKTVRDFLTG